jgi:hypothetical protein
MDQLGPEAAQGIAHARVYGSELYLGIGRERHAGDAVDRNPLVRTRPFSVLGGDHEHLVAHPEQLFYGVPEPRNYAIGGRKEGLGKEHDAHSAAPLAVAEPGKYHTVSPPTRSPTGSLATGQHQPPMSARNDPHPDSTGSRRWPA